MKRLTKEQISALPEWMPIEGFPNYEVNCRAGLVKSLYTGRLLKGSKGSSGYPQIHLNRDGKAHSKRLHRIVALAAFSFYNISIDGLDVCHLDEERHNPCIDNLAIGTTKENMNFEKAKQRKSEATKGEKSYWFGKHPGEEIRKKMSESHKGKRLSEEIRKKMSEARKGEKNYWFGKHKSEEIRKKISEARKGIPNIKLSRRVGAYKNGELIMTFQSTSEAGRNGFSSGHVSACCRGERRVHKGYNWYYI